MLIDLLSNLTSYLPVLQVVLELLRDLARWCQNNTPQRRVEPDLFCHTSMETGPRPQPDVGCWRTEMHITKNQTWAGLHVGQARALLRRLKWHGEFGFDGLQLENDLAALDIRGHDKDVLLDKLVNEELVEPATHGDGWQTTIRGNALAAANLSRRLKRKTADRLVRELLERVRGVNEGPYAFRVSRVRVFGSYLSDAETLGDIDLVVELQSLASDLDQRIELENARIRAAIAAGRTFKRFVDEVAWPEQEVLQFLKNRSRYLSFHRAEELKTLGCESKTLFGRPTCSVCTHPIRS